MKILHTGDIHLGSLNGPTRDGKNARREDTLECMRAIARSAAEEKPDLSIIAGDLFNRSKVWADTALEDIEDAAVDLIRPLCEASDKVVLLFGTMNHDNPKAYSVLRQITKDLSNLHIYTGPAVETLHTEAGDIQILAMPGFDKGRLRAFMPDADQETENQNATALVNEIILGNAARLDPTIPSVLVAHYTVAGAEGESGQTFLAGQDIVILPQTIDSTNVDLATFGHIHKPQKLGSNTPAYYCGSPNELTFNDEDIPHGFYYHTIDGHTVTESRFVETPARKHFSMKLEQEDVAEFIATGKAPLPMETKDAIVRVFYECTPEQEKQLNRAALQQNILEEGKAFWVADFIREESEAEAALDAAAAEDTPADALHRYLTSLKDGGADFTEADQSRMEELAAPIIRQADDGREADQHAGAFIPKRIEVKNYRSYTKAEFDFTDIRMAMVNGHNGVGKSSLFMDAIADCLYEESRDGATGGWLRVGEKSGAVTFEFEMGGNDYRVARTRTASKKGTLSLSRLNKDTGEWESETDTTMRLTQERIDKIIGMDCQTFCSIALIRQDAYGLFLDADSDRRMEVLSTLLNLGLYGRAEEVAKAKATEQRRKIAQTNDRMMVLDEQMKSLEQIEADLATCQKHKEMRTAQISALDAQIKAAEKEETLRLEMVRQADEKDREAGNLDTKAAEKEAELKKQEAERDEAQKLAAMASQAKEAAATVEQARKDLEPLVADEAKIDRLTDQMADQENFILRTESEIEAIKMQMEKAKATLADREKIEAAQAEMEAVRKAREELAPRMSEYSKATKELAELKNKATALVSESRVRIGGIEAKIKAAEQKTILLDSSGCPIVETASCAFLKDAQEAKATLADLKLELEETKTEDKATYEELQGQIKDAEARVSDFGNPVEEMDTLDKRERTASPVAAQSGTLEKAAATLEQLEKQKAEKEAASKEAEKRMEEAQKEMEPILDSKGKANELRAKIKAAEPIAALQSQCAAAEATVKALSVTIDLLTKDAEKSRSEAATARQEAIQMRERIPAETAGLESLRAGKKAIEAESEELAQVIGGLQAKIEAIEEAKEQWQTYRREKAQAAQTLHDYETLAAAFGLDGIQYTIIRNTVPEIQGRANAILAAMTGGRMAVDFRTEREQSNKKIVNTLDVWINTLDGIGRPYASHSGGEKVKIALAVTLGLADIKAHRAGVQLGMLWIDEPPFLDADGTDAYADALVSMANRNPQMRILAISHDPTMKARFPQNITVAAGENGSEVSMG